MSVGHKSSNVQFFRLMLYGRPLHPELFDLQQRTAFRSGDYEVENWLIPGGHVVRFQVGGHCLTETVIERGDHLPETGLIHALPCFGEKDYTMAPLKDARLGYLTTVQTEALSDNLYQATFREMQAFGQETGAMVHEWTEGDDCPCLSIMDSQRYKREYHIQSYHLLGATGMVLRTQSVFELK
jgi:hypothetical protein